MVLGTRGQLLLSLASGALAAAAMPATGAWPLAFVMLIPLAWALDEGAGFRAGFAFGVAFFALDLRWVLTLFRFSPLVVPGYILLIAYLAATVGLATWILARLRRRCGPWRWAVALGALFALIEWLRALGPLGLTFPSLYLTLSTVPAWIQLAAWMGPAALTALLVTANGFLALAMKRRAPRFLWGTLIALGLLWTPHLAPPTPDVATPLRFALVSSRVEQETKLGARDPAPLQARYVSLGREALAGRPDVIVFPESILPIYTLRDAQALEEFASLARDGATRVLLGTGDVRNREIFNSVALLDPSGAVVSTYDMVRPVPFGEYIPARALLEGLGLSRMINSFLPRDLTAGRSSTPLAEFGTPICFESTFAKGPRDFVRAGARILVVVTNDAWFSGRAEARAHFAFASLRAVETRRYVVQAANGGLTGAVSPTGRVLAQTDREGVTYVEVVPREEVTPYVRFGDGPAIAALALAAAVAWARRRPTA
ncbi:MAG: apolipoprotein N-acyltransferase [Candidatus Bipolaricaulota bacterium]